MTPRQIELLECTVTELRRRSVFAAQLFYCRLFARRPGLRRQFAGRPDFHGTRLLAVVSSAVAGMSEPWTAARQADHADAIGEAMEWMLQQHFHGQLTDEVREAWQAAQVRIAHAVEHDLF